MADAVAATVTAIDPESEPLLAASIELARVYARQLDQAAIIRAAADKALRAAERDGDEALIEQVAALRAKCGERDAVVQIGQRLHALLAELQATPKARGAKPSTGGGGKLARLRAVE